MHLGIFKTIEFLKKGSSIVRMAIITKCFPNLLNFFFKYGTFVYMYKWINHISNLLHFLTFQFFDDVDILSCYDLYLNPTDPMTRKLFSTKIINIVCGAQWKYIPKSGPIQFKSNSNYDSRTKPKSPFLT